MTLGSPLLIAAYKRHVNRIAKLREANADVNQATCKFIKKKNKSKWYQPLLRVAYKGYVNCEFIKTQDYVDKVE